MEDLEECLEEAKSLEVSGKYADADRLYTNLIDIAQQSGNPILADFFNSRGIARRMLGRYDESFDDYLSAISVSQTNDQRALAFINMADINRVAHSDFAKAHCSLDEALTYCENGTLLHVKAVDQRGLVFVGQKDFNSAIEAYRTARDICRSLVQARHNDKDVQNRFGQVVHHLGVAYVFLNDPNKVDEAYESQLTALEVFRRLGDQQGIFNTVATIGKIAMIRNDPDEAIRQYESALRIVEQTGYGRAITGIMFDLAEAYLQKGDSQNACLYLVRFRDGVLRDDLTSHDIGLMKEQFGRVNSLYDSAGLSVDRFDEVRARFG